MAKFEKIHCHTLAQSLLIGGQILSEVLKQIYDVKEMAGSAFARTIPRIALIEIIDECFSGPALSGSQSRHEKGDVIKVFEDMGEGLVVGNVARDAVLL